MVVEKTLRSLPPRFESLVVTLEEKKHMSMFTIDELQASITKHEQRLDITNTYLEGAFMEQSSISCGRDRGETTPEA